MAKVTEEQVDAQVEAVVREISVNPEALAQLREQYGVTIDAAGQLVEIKEPKRLRKAVRKQLEEQQEDEHKARDAAQAVARGASKTGQLITYGLVDAPIEGAKTAKAVTKSAARNTREKFAEAHERRLAQAEARRQARKLRKEQREALKAAQEAEQTTE